MILRATPPRLFVPAIERRALLAIYAFNVEVSRVHEHVSQPLPGEMRMQWWTDMLGGRSAMAASKAIRSRPSCCWRSRIFACRPSALSRLIDEHQFDLYNDPMPSMAALEGYADATSSRAVLARRA